MAPLRSTATTKPMWVSSSSQRRLPLRSQVLSKNTMSPGSGPRVGVGREIEAVVAHHPMETRDAVALVEMEVRAQVDAGAGIHRQHRAGAVVAVLGAADIQPVHPDQVVRRPHQAVLALAELVACDCGRGVPDLSGRAAVQHGYRQARARCNCPRPGPRMPAGTRCPCIDSHRLRCHGVTVPTHVTSIGGCGYIGAPRSVPRFGCARDRDLLPAPVCHCRPSGPQRLPVLDAGRAGAYFVGPEVPPPIMPDPLGARAELRVDRDRYTYYRLAALAAHGAGDLDRLPYSLRILLESLLRGCADGADGAVTREQVLQLAAWRPQAEQRPSLPYRPARVIMQDLTGVPAVVDLGAMRAAMARLGGDPSGVNPQAPMDLVIDHSVQVDHFGSGDALARNAKIEFSRNRERFEFLHWGQSAFANFRVVPPATGIVHQVNLEYLASVVMVDPHDAANSSPAPLVYPDTLVGTDSHTTMINGLGVLGWGVGGIEAEAALLGQPYDMLTPEVVGVRLIGRRQPGTTATDVTLAVVELLRAHGVVGKFVEFTGPGLASMSLPDRATIANMAPEYGATIGFFPVDDETLRYLHLSGRPEAACNLVEAYCRTQGLYRHRRRPRALPSASCWS